MKPYRDHDHDNTYYNIWQGIKQRCYNQGKAAYVQYGARGITMASFWIADFDKFQTDLLEEIGPRPVGATLDRIDNDGNYEPGNLRWSTAYTQNANRRRTGGSSKYVGVSRTPDGWKAQGSVKGVRHYIGHFTDEVQAAQAYDNWLIQVRPNEEITLNFPREEVC